MYGGADELMDTDDWIKLRATLAVGMMADPQAGRGRAVHRTTETYKRVLSFWAESGLSQRLGS